jgi:hypothetical protein
VSTSVKEQAVGRYTKGDHVKIEVATKTIDFVAVSIGVNTTLTCETLGVARVQ